MDGEPESVGGGLGAENHPYHRLLGIEVEAVGDGRSGVRLPMKSDVLNVRATVHGGAIASLFDIAMGLAVRSVSDGRPAMTTTLTVNYFRPPSGDLVAEGSVVRTGRTLIGAEAQARDADGTVVAQAIATFAVCRSSMKTQP